MSDIVEGQLWQVHVRVANKTIGYSIVTTMNAPVSWVEDIALDISSMEGANRQISSMKRVATVYTRRVLHE